MVVNNTDPALWSLFLSDKIQQTSSGCLFCTWPWKHKDKDLASALEGEADARQAAARTLSVGIEEAQTLRSIRRPLPPAGKLRKGFVGEKMHNGSRRYLGVSQVEIYSWMGCALPPHYLEQYVTHSRSSTCTWWMKVREKDGALGKLNSPAWHRVPAIFLMEWRASKRHNSLFICKMGVITVPTPRGRD